jgi:hypothetical protein
MQQPQQAQKSWRELLTVKHDAEEQDLRKQQEEELRQQQDHSQLDELHEKQKLLLKQFHKQSFQLQLKFKEQMLQLRKIKLQNDIRLVEYQQLLLYEQQDELDREEVQLQLVRTQLEQ